MIDLLPTAAKNTLKREQRKRFLSGLILAFAMIGVVTAVSSLPTGLLLSHYEESVLAVGGLATEVAKRRSDVEKDLEVTRALIEYLSTKNQVKPYSLIVSDLDRLAGEDVFITHFNFDNKKKLVLSGLASTRSTLSAFRDRLAAHESFKTVELPLSSLVKDADVPFSITITLR